MKEIKSYFVYHRPGYKKYYVRFTFEDGSQVAKSSGTSDYKEALKWANGYRFRSTNQGSGVMLGEYIKGFFKPGSRYVKRVRTYNASLNDRWMVEKNDIAMNHVYPSKLAGKTLASITTKDIEKFTQDLKPIKGKGELSANTKNKILLTLQIVLKEAHQEGYIDRVPVINKTTHIPKEKSILTLAELNKLLPTKWGDIYPTRLPYVGILLAATTGMRLSEVLGLEFRHIDFEMGSVRIEQSWDTRLLKLNKFTKSKAPRDILITDRVLEELIILQKSRNAEDDSYVFESSRSDRPVDDKYLPFHFKKGIKVSGIALKTRRVTFHSLRHGVNTYLIKAKIDPFKVATYLGHSNRNNMTALYNHSELEDQEDIREYFTNNIPL